MSALDAMLATASETALDRLADRIAERVLSRLTMAGSSAGLRVGDAARKLGLSRATVTRMIGDGRIASTKVGRARLVPASEVDRLLVGAAATNADTDDAAQIACALLDSPRGQASKRDRETESVER